MICPKCGEDALIVNSLTVYTDTGSISTMCLNCNARFYSLLKVQENDFTGYKNEEGGSEE